MKSYSNRCSLTRYAMLCSMGYMLRNEAAPWQNRSSRHTNNVSQRMRNRSSCAWRPNTGPAIVTRYPLQPSRTGFTLTGSGSMPPSQSSFLQTRRWAWSELPTVLVSTPLACEPVVTTVPFETPSERDRLLGKSDFGRKPIYTYRRGDGYESQR